MTAWFDSVLVANWRTAWKWVSIQLAVVAASIQAAIIAVPSIRDYLGDATMHYVGLVLIVSIVLGRLVDQSKGP